MNSVSCGNGKLRQWLIDQIDSGKYPGLVWENDEKSIFRIPWKHAGKQDYNREEDAALFKVGLSLGLGLWDTAGAAGTPGGSAVAPRHPSSPPTSAGRLCWVPAAAGCLAAPWCPLCLWDETTRPFPLLRGELNACGTAARLFPQLSWIVLALPLCLLNCFSYLTMLFSQPKSAGSK